MFCSLFLCRSALHLALLPPLERAGFDADAGRALAGAATAAAQHVVGAPNQLRRGVDSVADQPHGRVGGDAAALGGFAAKKKEQGDAD